MGVVPELIAVVRARMQEPIRAGQHTTTLPLFDATQLEIFRTS